MYKSHLSFLVFGLFLFVCFSCAPTLMPHFPQLLLFYLITKQEMMVAFTPTLCGFSMLPTPTPSNSSFYHLLCLLVSASVQGEIFSPHCTPDPSHHSQTEPDSANLIYNVHPWVSGLFSLASTHFKNTWETSSVSSSLGTVFL